MRWNKKHAVMIALGAIMIITTSAAVQKDNTYTNLQVLPKNISTKALSKIMVDEFEDGLGVGCNFCHAPSAKDTTQLDYASDAKPEKQIARLMMRMTLNINKQYFMVKQPMLGSPILQVTCNTCHNGQPHPDMAAN